MPYKPNYKALVPWLEGKGSNTYSQFGEDGLIAAALEHYGIRNRHCFEVGAYDGQRYSNTKKLRDAGWSALLVESLEDLAERARQFESDLVTVVHATVTPSNWEGILADAKVPLDCDLGIIDIDGQDYWLWDSMVTEPRLMLIEYDCYRHDDFTPQPGGEGQATIQPIMRLGRAKGYEPLAVTYCNVLFAKVGT